MRIVRSRPVASFFVLALVLSWAVWIPSTLLLSGNAAVAMLFLGSFGPAVAGALLTKARGRSLQSWVIDMARFRVGVRWWLAAVGLPVAVAGVGTVAYAVWVGPLDFSTLPGRVARWLVGLVAISLVGGGNEEPGWRGYALPNLQRDYSALTASLVVGAVWAVWHVPLFVLESGLYYGKPFSLYAPMVLLLSVVMTWVYNSTGGSVPVVMVLHAGINSASALIPANLAGSTPSGAEGLTLKVLLACAAVLVLVVVVRYGPESLSSRGRRTTAAVDGESTGDAGQGFGDPTDD